MMEDKQNQEVKASKREQAGTMKRGKMCRHAWREWAKKQSELVQHPAIPRAVNKVRACAYRLVTCFAVTKAEASVQELLARLCFTHDYFLCSERGCPMVGKFNVSKTYYNRRGLLCGLCAKLALPGGREARAKSGEQEVVTTGSREGLDE